MNNMPMAFEAPSFCTGGSDTLDTLGYISCCAVGGNQGMTFCCNGCSKGTTSCCAGGWSNGVISCCL